jgi:hypothetical protein
VLRFLQAVAEWCAPRGKAIVAGLAPAALMFIGFAQDGLDAYEVTMLITAVLGGFGITYAVPNAAAKSAPKAGGK